MKSTGLMSSLSFVGLTTVGMLLAGTQSAIAASIQEASKDIDNLSLSSITSNLVPTESGFKYTYTLYNGENGVNAGKITSFIVPLLGNTPAYIRDILTPSGWESSGVQSGSPASWPSVDISKTAFKSPDFYIQWTSTGGLGYLAEAEFSFESDYTSTKAPYVAFWDTVLEDGKSYTVGDPPIPAGPAAAVPTPSLLLGTVGMGIQMWRKKRQQLDA